MNIKKFSFKNKYERAGFWAVIAAIAVLAAIVILIVSNQTNTNILSNSDNKGFQMFLTDNSSSPDIDENMDINKLKLEDKPLLSGKDLISYNWDMHCIKIKNDGKISDKLLKRQFVVMTDGKRIYSGFFWSVAYTMNPPKIAVYLDKQYINGEFLFLALGSWRPGADISADTAKIIGDAKIQKVLERDGQMYKQYIPVNFKKPDYINIYNPNYNSGEVYGYGGIDWDKKDQLLKLLDKRFEKSLDYVRQDLSLKDDAAMAATHKQTSIILGYEQQHEIKNLIKGTDKNISCTELWMPVTGDYAQLMYINGTGGFEKKPLGYLSKFNNVKMLEKEAASNENKVQKEPGGINIVYYVGKPFDILHASVYELESEEAKKIKQEAAQGKLLKDIPDHKPETLPLILRYGKNDDRRFHVLDDRETVFYNGKHYYNPSLAKHILDIAEKHCGYKIFDTSVFKGLVKAKYSFRTNIQTIERITEDKAVLVEMEKWLQKAKHNMASGCPYSDGVLTLTLNDGTIMEILMAADDCPMMFINGNYMEYSKELHKLLERTFDNFPYVRNK